MHQFIFVVACFALANAEVVRHEEQKTTQHTGPLGSKKTEEVQQHSVKEESKNRREVGEKEQRGEQSKNFKLGEQSKEELVSEKKAHLFFNKQVEYFLNNPVTKIERECFSNYLKPGLSIDFVIDIAPSPSRDKVDKRVSESPIALFFERSPVSSSQYYFNAIQTFIDAVTVDMMSEATHSIIYEKGRKFYIRGRDVDDVEAVERLTSRGEFEDKERNLKTLWPICTKEEYSILSPIVKNNLGRMTKLSLWNRDNGLPIVLSSSRRSKPVYTIVISDGSSGAKIEDLVEGNDLTRTTVLDIGNRRFARNMSWEEMRRVSGIYTLASPKHLSFMVDTIRNMACLSCEHASKNV